MEEHHLLGLFPGDDVEQQLLVHRRAVLPVFGRLGQVKGTVELRQIGAVAHQEHGRLGLQLAGKGDQLGVFGAEFPFAVFRHK